MDKNTPRLKIAYVSINDPKDKRSWSGITYYLGNALQKNIGEVDFIGPVKVPYLLDKTLRGIAKINRMLLGKEYAYKYSLLRSWYASRMIAKRMKGKQYDCIVAPASSDALACLDTKQIPVVYMVDATFELISKYYKREFNKVLPFSLWEGNTLEKRSLEKSSLVIYASNWAANSAIEYYKTPPQKVAVLTMGANMDFVPSKDIIFEKEKNKVLTLLYLAVEWERKGGEIAFEALQALKQRGLRTRLIVCGCIPPPHIQDTDMEVIPFLNKNKSEDHERFVELLSFVHFLILPTRADCSLLVACESNAYGVPAIATNTGGVSDVVVDGINGYCLPYEARGEQYAKLISEIYGDKERYHNMIMSSRNRYEQNLNWDVWADRFRDLYLKHITP